MQIEKSLKAALVATGLAVMQQAAAYDPVTNERLLKPEPQNWLMYRGTYNGQGYSPLDKINTSNVKRLVPIWSYSTGQVEGHQAPPIVNNGVMFISTPQNQVLALNAKTGDLIWQYKREFADDVQHPHPTNRGVALYGDRVYLATMDAHVVALDANTGKVVWDTKVDEHKNSYYFTLAPLIAKGKVMVGSSGGEFGIRGYVAALDADTGKEVWRTHMIPGPGEPGHDTWEGDHWKTGGVSVWITGHYDPVLNLTYWGTGNAGPWPSDAHPGDNKHATSVVALDPDTGKIKGSHQYHWNDNWDWDEVSAPLLVDIKRNGRDIKALVHPGRNGYLWVLERKADSIDFVDGKPYVKHDVITGLDAKTGRVTYDMDKLLRVGKQVTFCPSHWGGKDWPPAAYNPKTRLLYIPLQQNLCTTLVGEAKIAPYAAGKRYVGTDAAKTRVFAREGADHIGEVQAWDLDTGKLVWTYNFPDMGINWGPLLTTGGGLIFGGGSADRKFRALDATSGKLLWEFKTNSGITGVPSSYMVDGVQYIAVQSGWGVDAQKMVGRLNTSMKTNVQVPQGGVVWVFAVKD
ncbi:MAG TPA: PQQ-dependent dehydrogenase, methanol/ethanol family [Burkholderiales bacterium]|jgi:alcohol dehydrogenase (cytochrome c)|nr:PQQ-dependent dehydrogenase, methanol/ethanol family [Burkholderiales bacterium]